MQNFDAEQVAQAYRGYANPMPPNQVLGVRIAILKCTQEELARLLDVAPKTVSRWESGKARCRGPHARLLWLLANVETTRPTLEQMIAIDYPVDPETAPKPEPTRESVFGRYQ